MSRLASLLPLLPLLLALVGCGTGDQAPAVAWVRDSAGIRIVENHPALSTDSCAFSPRPRVSVGVVEGDQEYQLFRAIDGTRLSDGRIAVANQGSAEIRLYDGEGRFAGAFGREGDGPGEFRRVFRVWRARGDTLVVGDYRPWRFSFFTPDGEYLGAVAPEPPYGNVPSTIGVLTDRTFVLGRECCHSEAPGFHEQWLHVVRHASTGEVLDTIGVYPGGRVGFLSREARLVGPPLFEATSRVVAEDERIVVGRGRDPELEVLDPEGRTRTIIRWEGAERTVTPEEVEIFREKTLEYYGDRPALGRRHAEPLVSEERPVNDRFPAHATILLGTTGDVWVQKYPRPSWPDDDDQRWLVFSPDGRFVCHARTPGAVRDVWDTWEIGGDYLLARATDEVGVEYVHVYGLSRPQG